MPISAIGGTGIALSVPPPSYNNLGIGGSNRVQLAPGDAFIIPSGTWIVNKGTYSFFQVLDPITNTWVSFSNDVNHGFQSVNSDGTNYRVANLTGCVIGALLTAAGTGYNATVPPIVVPSAGGSTWQAIVGGAISTTVTITSAGSGYTLPPIVAFPPPPAGVGIPAQGYATLSAGGVASVVLTAQGAGYLTPPVPLFLPNALETSTTIVAPVVATTLVGAGTVTALICLTPGTPQTAAPTLTISGTGTGAAATAIMCFTITGVTVGTAGVGVPGSSVAILTAGGYVTGTPAYTAAGIGGNKMLPVRNANISVPVTAGALGTPFIGDGGLFSAAPIPLIVSSDGAAPSTAPAATLILGGVPDTIFLQPV